MLPKKQRIPRAMFPLLASSKVAFFGNELFNFRFIFTDKLNSRFCFSVSKKISKSAVVRNRLRRAGYRLLSKDISNIKPGVVAIFRFKKIPKDDVEIESNISLILKGSKLISLGETNKIK